jgi:hypothetical protein
MRQAIWIAAAGAVVGMAIFAMNSAHAADAFRPASIAVPQISGYIGLDVGVSSQPTSLDGDDPTGTPFAFGGTGVVNVWLDSSKSLQFDIQGEGAGPYDYLNSPDQEARFGGVMGAHLDWRSASHAFGVFGGFTGTNNVDYCAGNVGGLGGGEVQAYAGNITFYAQGGYGGQFNNADCYMLDQYWFARGVIRDYINPNMRLSAEVAYATGIGQVTGGTAPALTQLSWGLGIEARPGSSPFSYYLKYAGDRISGPGTITQNTVLVGAKINFGSMSLLDNDRHGATFDMPAFYRGMYWSCAAGGNGC